MLSNAAAAAAATSPSPRTVLSNSENPLPAWRARGSRCCRRRYKVGERLVKVFALAEELVGDDDGDDDDDDDDDNDNVVVCVWQHEHPSFIFDGVYVCVCVRNDNIERVGVSRLVGSKQSAHVAAVAAAERNNKEHV